VYSEAIPGWDCGDVVAAWFSQYLKEDHRLLYNPGVELRYLTKPDLYVNNAKDDDKVFCTSGIEIASFCLHVLVIIFR